MTEQALNETTWWVLYPLKGLDIADAQHDLQTPMFGDATVLSRKYIRDIIPLLRLNERASPGHDHEASATYLFEHAVFGDNFNSLLAVKRKAPVDFSTNKLLKSAEPALRSRKRALAIASLLQLSILAESKNWETCALVEQIRSGDQALGMLALDEGSYACGAGPLGQSCTIKDRNKPLVVSRQELQQKYLHGQIAPLSAVLLPQTCPIGGSSARALEEASIRLCDAIHSQTPADHILGAATSIEILITNQGDSFETTHRRIAALVGQNAKDFFQAKEVLHERHLYVHRGMEPTRGLIPTKATALALCCILQYAKLAPGFRAKTTLLAYLDLVHLGQKISHTWTPEERDHFNGLLRHKNVEQHFEHFRAPP